MIVYHGSNQIVQKPDVEHSFRALDFGRAYLPKIRKLRKFAQQ